MTSDRDDIVGRLVDGRYRIDSVVARGGMSTVYLATDIRLDRTVAVKVMRRSLAEDQGFVARFEREAKAAARLSHPNVVGVFDQGSYDGLVFLVMEYVPGHTLRDVIVTYGALEPARALGVVDQVLLALSAAHTAGFVHRDIKPENVLITGDGMVKVADFGLARAMTGDSSATSQGLIIGTVAYLSPEQVESGHADERSDIYSAGVMLFELLTGTVPFEASTPLAVAFRHVNEKVPAPSELQPGIPDFVDDLVLSATAKDPTDRYPDAWTFAQALEEAQNRLAAGDTGGTAASHPASTGKRRSSRSRGAAAAAGVAGGVTAAAASSDGATAAEPPITNHSHPSPAEVPPAPSDAALSDEATVVVPARTDESPTEVFGGDVAAHAPTAMIRRGGGQEGTQVLTRPTGGTGSGSGGPIVIPATGTAAAATIGGAGGDAGYGGPAVPPPSEPDMLGVKPARRGGRLTLVLVLGILAALVAGGAWYLGSLRYVDMPDVTGQSVAEASRNLAVLELALVEAGKEPSDSVPSGTVLRTDPAAGVSARAGSTVEAIVSTGPELFGVPDVAGQTVEQATNEVTAAGLAVAGVEEVADAEVAKGQVVSTRPTAGTQLRGGTEVTLVVSRGSQPVTMPDLKGQSVADAKSQLTLLGLVATVKEEFAGPGTPTGMVMSTDPAAGTEVQAGDTVMMVVSKGQEAVTVPDVVGMGQQEAVATLQAAGLTPATKNQLAIVVLDRVYAQDPAAGTSLPRGSTVTLTIV